MTQRLGLADTVSQLPHGTSPFDQGFHTAQLPQGSQAPKASVPVNKADAPWPFMTLLRKSHGIISTGPTKIQEEGRRPCLYIRQVSKNLQSCFKTDTFMQCAIPTLNVDRVREKSYLLNICYLPHTIRSFKFIFTLYNSSMKKLLIAPLDE